jgi:hypothetical protein
MEDSGQGVGLNLEKSANKGFSKEEAGNRQVEGAS